MDEQDIFLKSIRLLKGNDIYDEENMIFRKVYEINGDIYEEDINNDVISFQEFIIQIEDENNENTDTDEYLDVSLQAAAQGVIVNSIIFVKTNHWHAVINDEDSRRCIPCDKYVRRPEDHIKNKKHLINLDKYRPLKKFDYNITRRIGDSYHCVICNVIFDDSNIDIHFDSRDHERNVLFSTNRANDILYDMNLFPNLIDKMDVYRNRVTSSSDGSFDDESVIDDHVTYDDSIDTSGKISYASVAKKPAIATEYVDYVLGGKRVKIKFDSWHMVVVMKINEYYCMACVQHGPIGQKAKHCLTKEHSDKLGKCRVVDRYKRHFIRNVDDKHYHCGNCNSLQTICDIDEHILLVHSKSKSIQNKDIVMKKTQRIRNENDESKMNEKRMDMNQDRNYDSEEISEQINQNNIYESNGNRMPQNNIYESNGNRMPQNNIILPTKFTDLNLFNYNLRISFLSYNMIMCHQNHFFCVICDYYSTTEYMTRHIADLSHVERIMRTPFDPYFNINLMRRVDRGVHCAICNVAFDMRFTRAHVIDPMHRYGLSQCVINPPIAVNNLTTTPEEEMSNQKANEILNNSITESTEHSKVKSTEYSKLESTNHSKMESTEHSKMESTNHSKMESTEHSKMESTEHSKIESTRHSKIDTKNETNENESLRSKLNSYDCEFIYLKFNNKDAKVTFKAFNGLISVDDGSSYCFLCSVEVSQPLGQHIKKEGHLKYLESNHFIDKYKRHLLRQISNKFHCCTCNIMFSKSELQAHVIRPGIQIKTDKKIKKSDFKTGLIQIDVNTKQESFVSNDSISNIEIKSKSKNVEITKHNKMIVFNGGAVKVSWDFWHGLSKTKNGYRCLMCVLDLRNYEINEHITSEKHNNAIENTFEIKFLPSLIRKVNNHIMHCVTCNMAIRGLEHSVYEHVNGKKHQNNLTVTKDKDIASNCTKDIFYLK